MKITPVNNNIIVQKEKFQAKTESGLHLPSEPDTPTVSAKVRAVPNTELKDVNEEPIQIKEGTVVMFDRYQGADINFKGTAFTIIDAEHILAVITED